MGSRRIEESDAEYKRLSIQRKTSKKVDGKIYRIVQDRESNIKECSEAEAASLHEDLSSSEY